MMVSYLAMSQHFLTARDLVMTHKCILHHYTLSSWDVAAGSILIEEAGGSMTDLKNERWNLRTRKICGSNGGKVHEEILDALGEAGVV